MLRKVLWSIGAVLTVAAGGLSIVAAGYQPVLPPRVWIGPVDVAGLTHDQAARKLRLWWDTERRRELTFSGPDLARLPEPRSLTSAGLLLDDRASVNQVPEERFWEAARRALRLREPERRRFPVVFATDAARVDALADEVERLNSSARRASVTFHQGAFRHTTELAGASIDAGRTAEALLAVAATGAPVLELPVVEGPKRVPDEALRSIREVVSSFTTRFSAAQRNRSSNIRLAASKIDGTVLMPGETFSFNGAVGRRTKAAGFRLAGVFVAGRHDTGIGGGICQVSTTLYNAALLADMKIVERQNHSLPVPYVPAGRDATVAYGAIDFRFQNSADGPVAISALYEPGRITFRVLGQRKPGLEVRVVSGPVQSWSRGERVVHDGALPYGKSRVIERGAPGRRVSTYRVVKLNGIEIRRDQLGTSRYSGAVRIVARNLRAGLSMAPPVPAPVDAEAAVMP